MRHGDTGSVSRGRRSLTPQTRLVASPIPMPPAFGAHSEVLPAPSLPREDVQWAREVGAVPLPASPSVRVALPATFPQVASPQYTASAVVGDVHGASRYAADVKSPLHVREAAPAVVPLARPLLASSPSAGGCDYTYSVQHDVQRDVRDAYLHHTPTPIADPAPPVVSPVEAVPLPLPETYVPVVPAPAVELPPSPALEQAAIDHVAATTSLLWPTAQPIEPTTPLYHSDYAVKRQHPKGPGRNRSSPAGKKQSRRTSPVRLPPPAWVAFSHLAEENGIRAEDLGLLFWDTVEQLCRHFGLTDPIELSAIQEEWRRQHPGKDNPPPIVVATHPPQALPLPATHTPSAEPPGLGLHHEPAPQPERHPPTPSSRADRPPQRSPSPTHTHSPAPVLTPTQKYWDARALDATR